MITKLALVSTECEGTAVLIASGEIDLSTAPDFATALRQATPAAAPLIVNLTGIEFMDSSGLNTLAKARLEARAKGSRLLIVPSPQVTRTLEIAGATNAFELHPAMSDALRLVRIEA